MTRLTLQGRLKPQLAIGGGDGNKYSTTMMIDFEHKLVLGGGGGAPSLPLGLLLHKRRFSFQGGDSTTGSCTGSFKVFASSTKSSPPSSSSSSSSSSAKKKSIQSKYFCSPNASKEKGAAARDYDDDDDDNGGIVYDDGEDEFIEREDELSCFRGLVLDISYRPVNVVCWKRAICLEFMEKADVLEYYDQTVDSPSGSFYIPAVLRVPHLLQVVKRRRIRNTLSRKNIYFRDSFTCQYCSSCENLTVDHVLPVSRGGEWKWENLVTACYKCNSKKGHKTVEEAKMQLLKVPKAPKEYEILAIPLTNAAIKMLKMRKGTPEEWHQYLLKPSSSEPQHRS